MHFYNIAVEWTGNTGSGTYAYNAYSRSHNILAENKPDILCSSDPSFRGDATRHNPEELLLSSLASCHMLWYLHLCSEAKVIVTAYTDNATGTMIENADGSGKFTAVTLNPIVTVADANMIEKATALHHKANKMCFIANSVNFPVMHNPIVILQNKN